MSDFIKTNKYWLLMTVVVAAVVLTSLLVVNGREPYGDQRPQEITLVSRDVAFWLADRPDKPNPVLELTRGRPVKLVLINEEPQKVLHCFTISGLNVHSSRDLAAGESGTITFTPTETGIFAYACLMHPSMTGQVIVR